MLKEPDAMAVICNSTRLQQYLVFPPEVNVTLVSQSLCRVNSSNVKDFTNVIVGQIDVQKILDIVSRDKTRKGSLKISVNTLKLERKCRTFCRRHDLMQFLDRRVSCWFNFAELSSTLDSVNGLVPSGTKFWAIIWTNVEQVDPIWRYWALNSFLIIWLHIT